MSNGILQQNSILGFSTGLFSLWPCSVELLYDSKVKMMIKVIQMVMTAFMVMMLTYSTCHEQQEGLSCLEEDEGGLNNDQVLHTIELVIFLCVH